jgi:CRP-like cAMP-binding protein
MQLHKDAKVDLIRHVPLFAECSKKELKQIAGLADEIDFKAGKVLIHEGRPGREFFVLVEGQVEVSRGGKRIDTMQGGNFFGEVALVSDHPRNATVTTTTPVDVLVITDRSFRTLLADSPQIQRKVLTALADRLAPVTL